MSVKVIALAGLVSMVLFGCASSKPVIDLAANVKEDVPDHAVATVAPRGWTSVCYRCVKQLRLDEDLVYDFERDGPAKEFRRALAILQVEKGAHARVEERLERAGRLDLLAPSRLSSLTMRIWNGGRALSASMSRRKPGRFTNSAPLIPPSST
jgi:hypothetical protein